MSGSVMVTVIVIDSKTLKSATVTPQVNYEKIVLDL